MRSPWTLVLNGRNLSVTVDDVPEPYVVKPLPGNAAREALRIYLAAAAGRGDGVSVAGALAMCIDGAVQGFSGAWGPKPLEEQLVSTRASKDLSLGEMETFGMIVLLWQSPLGIRGAQEYIDLGGGTAAAVRMTLQLANRLKGATHA